MKKRRYEKPSMKVHELAQRTRLSAHGCSLAAAAVAAWRTTTTAATSHGPNP